MSLARVILTGTLTSEPEKRFTNNNIAVTSFQLQVTAVGRNESPFAVRVSCWRNLAETVSTSLQKGQTVTVEGRLQINQFEGAGGIARKVYEIDASNVYVGELQALGPMFEMSDRQNNAQGPARQAAPAAQPAAVGASSGGFSPDEILTEDDIPF